MTDNDNDNSSDSGSDCETVTSTMIHVDGFVHMMVKRMVAVIVVQL